MEIIIYSIGSITVILLVLVTISEYLNIKHLKKWLDSSEDAKNGEAQKDELT